MQFNLKSLFLWFLVFYFLIDGGIDNYIKYGNIESISFGETIFSLTSPLSFFLFWLFSYFVLFRFYPERKWLYIISGLILSFLGAVMCRFIIEQKLLYYLIGYSNYPQHTELSYYIFDQYLFASRYMPFGIIYYFVRYSIYNQKREKELTIENQKMELSLLRAQINPHFLMNSLNNIQSLVYLKSDRATDAIDHLSDLLKYTLYQNEKWITIREEMDMIEKYISLERLRHDYEFVLDIDIDEELYAHEIPQYLLLPLFENAFKHAQLKSKDYPFFLRITKSEKGILIQSSNEMVRKSKDGVGGIGLENLRKRLELLFEKNYTLEIEQNNNNFYIKILLPDQ